MIGRVTTSGVATCPLDQTANHAAPRGRGHWPKSIAADDVPGFEYFSYRRAQKDTDSTGHPNQKPLPLLQWIVKKLPRGIILDPYAGSGTTLIAAAMEGHEAIGIERNPDYFRMASNRIAGHRAALSETLFA